MRNPSLRRPTAATHGGRNRPLARRGAPRLGVATAAGLIVASAVGFAPPASAQVGGSEELAAQVDRIVAKRASLSERISVLDEQANLAKAELAEVEERSEVNETDVAAAEKNMSAARSQVRRYAVRAFTGGMDSGAMSAHDNPTDAIRSRTLLASAQGNREQAVEEVRAARSDLGAKQQLLDETAEAKADAQQRITAARDEMKVAEEELATTEAQVKGDLAEALQREEQQRAAAERAEAERRQAEAEAQAQAMPERVQAQARDDAEAASDAESSSADSERAGSSSSATTSSSRSTSAPTTATGSGRSSAAAPATAAPATQAPRTTAAPTTAAPAPVAPAPTPAAPAPSSQGERAVAAALSMRGTPYRWGGESPSTGFDCSGLVLWAYAQAGRTGIPHSSRMQVAMGRRISVGELVPGDLVAYGSPVHHIGIYIGGGQYVHAPSTGDVVKVASIYRFNGTPIAVRI
ncbi:MAG: C40 family peptidase [Microthrixaceae bacterium]|nr:C40 family peptidase [Microthrixaceae bacterium]